MSRQFRADDAGPQDRGDPPCDGCGLDPLDCTCPECLVCGEAGTHRCYYGHTPQEYMDAAWEGGKIARQAAKLRVALRFAARYLCDMPGPKVFELSDDEVIRRVKDVVGH